MFVKRKSFSKRARSITEISSFVHKYETKDKSNTSKAWDLTDVMEDVLLQEKLNRTAPKNLFIQSFNHIAREVLDLNRSLKFYVG